MMDIIDIMVSPLSEMKLISVIAPCKQLQWLLLIFFFLIRNEEDYINKRTNTEEKKETKEREKKTPREG